MKWSTKILTALLIVIVAGLLASNIVLKQEYNKLDKNDTYWTYGKLSEQHFKYVKIEGGNSTKIAFEQSPNCSVRVLHDWQRVRPNPIETIIKNDTLYIKFIYSPADEGEKNWMHWLTLVRVFAPELTYVEGFNTNFFMNKMKQKNISVNMSGKSKFEIESFIPDFDSVYVTQKDSSEVVFEMSPEYKPTKPIQNNSQILIKGQPEPNQINREAFTMQSLDATLEGNTLLDVGRGKIQSLKLDITDTSAIILSGHDLRKLRDQHF